MFRTLVRWIEARKGWKLRHEANWSGFTESSHDGRSLFQREMIKALDAAGYHIEFENAGKRESYLVGSILGSRFRMFLYRDGVHVTGGTRYAEFRAEHWEYDSPQQFISEFIEWVKSLIVA